MKRDRFKYVKLNDAVRRVGEKFNLIGIVKDFKLPRPSNGTDKCIVIRIADESYQSPGIPLTVFGRRFEDLPLVVSPGDIIIVSRVNIQNHDGVITADYHTQYSSFALYEGRVGTNFNPYQASSNFDRAPANSTLRMEQRLIAEQRKWLVNFQPATYHLKKIRDIGECQVLSFVGKILYKQDVYPGKWIIYFWDGSNAPPVIIKTMLGDENDNLVKLQLEPEPLPRDVLSTFPRSGSILRKPWGKIRYVQEDSPSQLHCQRCNLGQGSSVLEEMVGCCISSPTQITEVDPVDVTLVSLMDALSCSLVVGKFKCIVRVVSVSPWPIEDFVSPEGILRVRLTLEDPTARIHALLCEEDGAYFVNGLFGNNLRLKMDLLVGVGECALRNPPWVLYFGRHILLMVCLVTI